ncbi:hypothetical protein D3C79_501070 [compost metagenome]
MFQRRTMLAGFDPQARGFNADQANAGIIDKVGKHADGVGTAANAGQYGIRQTAFTLQHLSFGFFADHALEFTHDGRERVRACGSTQHVVSLFVRARPVAQRFVTGIFQRGRAAVHRDHFCSHQAHTKYVR